jgi:ABC-type glycerol-3-phosphate transport system substrate-binding protein
VSLLYWRRYAEGHQQTLAHQAVFDHYQEQHPGRVTIEIGEGGAATAVPKVKTAVAAGTPPDMWLTWQVEAADIFALGALVDLQQPLKSQREWGRLKGELVPSLLEAATWKGQLTVMPVNFGPHGLGFNKRHLQEASVPLPAFGYTWEDFLTVGRRAAQPPDRVLFDFQYTMNYLQRWLGANGQRPLNAERTKVQLDTPQARETLLWVHEQVQRSQLARAGGASFDAGGSVTEIINVATVTTVRYPNVDPGDGSGIYVTHYPLGPSNSRKQPTSPGNVHGLSVFKAAPPQKVAAAAEIAAWAVRPDVQARMADVSNLAPSNPNATRQPAYPQRLQSNPLLKALFDLARFGAPEPNFPSWSAATAILDEHLQRVAKGELLPRDALAQAQPRMQALIDEDLRRG